MRRTLLRFCLFRFSCALLPYSLCGGMAAGLRVFESEQIFLQPQPPKRRIRALQCVMQCVMQCIMQRVMQRVMQFVGIRLSAQSKARATQKQRESNARATQEQRKSNAGATQEQRESNA
jgi:hypothetical protein